MNNTIKVIFKKPIIVKKSEVTEVTVRATKVKDELTVSKATEHPLEQEVMLVSIVTNIPKSDIEELETWQYEKILGAMGNLKLGKIEKTQ